MKPGSSHYADCLPAGVDAKSAANEASGEGSRAPVKRARCRQAGAGGRTGGRRKKGARSETSRNRYRVVGRDALDASPRRGRAEMLAAGPPAVSRGVNRRG
jgi:hypothetical protein